jgi:hypothetical protein
MDMQMPEKRWLRVLSLTARIIIGIVAGGALLWLALVLLTLPLGSSGLVHIAPGD